MAAFRFEFSFGWHTERGDREFGKFTGVDPDDLFDRQIGVIAELGRIVACDTFVLLVGNGRFGDPEVVASLHGRTDYSILSNAWSFNQSLVT